MFYLKKKYLIASIIMHGNERVSYERERQPTITQSKRVERVQQRIMRKTFEKFNEHRARAQQESRNLPLRPVVVARGNVKDERQQSKKRRVKRSERLTTSTRHVDSSDSARGVVVKFISFSFTWSTPSSHSSSPEAMIWSEKWAEGKTLC